MTRRYLRKYFHPLMFNGICGNGLVAGKGFENHTGVLADKLEHSRPLVAVWLRIYYVVLSF